MGWVDINDFYPGNNVGKVLLRCMTGEKVINDDSNVCYIVSEFGDIPHGVMLDDETEIPHGAKITHWMPIDKPDCFNPF